MPPFLPGPRPATSPRGSHTPAFHPTMTLPSPLAAACLAALLLAPLAAHAGPGHDHGEAAPAATGPALPRFAAVSEAFELVGVLDGRQLTLYLDRAPDNSPVPEARIELEIGGARHVAEAQPEARYALTLDAEPQPGLLPVTAVVTVGDEADLLAGELDIHDEAHVDEAVAPPGWQRHAGWIAGGLLALGLLGWLARRDRAPRVAQTGGAA